MKKIIIILTVIISMPFIVCATDVSTDISSNLIAQATTVNSSNPDSKTTTVNSSNPTEVEHLSNPLDPKINSVGDLVKSGVEVFSYIAVLIGVIMFVVVGLKYILARGNTEKIKEASKWLLAIVIGVAIIIGARVAITIVINTLSATKAVDPKVIQSAQNAIKN